MNTQNRERSKICYLAPDVAVPSPRGSSVHVMELGQNLAKLGHEVYAVTRRVKESDLKEEEIEGIRVHRIYRWVFRPETRSSYTGASQDVIRSTALSRAYYFYLLTVFRLYVCFVSVWLIRKYKLDIILERETSFGAGGLASILTGKPMVLEIIGPRYSRLSAWRSRRIFYYTESMLRKWVDRKKCIQVPAGVNLSLFRESSELRQSFRAKLGFGPEEMVVGYVGTFQNWHGVDTALAALVSLKRNFPDIRMLLVGPAFESYSASAKEKGVDHLCVFTGAVDYGEVPGYINACDVMLALYDPSKDPIRAKFGIGWPIKILEYMGCAKPVISTKVEPIDKIITDDGLGLLITPGSSSELENALAELVENPKKISEIGVRSKQVVNSRYSWGLVARAISSHLDS